MRANSRFTTADLTMLVLVCVWGINYSVVKGAISGPAAPFSPIAFNALRFAVASLALLVMLRRVSTTLPAARRDWLAIIGLGLLGNSLYQMLFIVGISYTSPVSSALILAATPVFVALIGAVSRIERLTGLAWIGIALSFAGLVIVTLGNESSAAHSAQAASPLLGDGLILGATIVWSMYTTLSAPLLKHYSATMLTSLSVTIGSVPLFLIAVPDLIRQNWSAMPVSGWSGVAFSGLFALALGYVIWNRGVKHLGGARTAIYSNLTPVIAAVVAWLVRGDALTIYHLIGAAIILAGINLTRIGRQARIEPLPAEE